MKQLILASKSPRRKELLEKCGIPFSVDVADIDESICETNPLTSEIENLAFRKAKTVLERHPDSVVIGSDTIVVLNNEVLGKPKDRADARRMLEGLSGTTHQVITGLCILSCNRQYISHTVSDVTFSPLSEEEIEDYIASGEADDKAGAYGIQGLAGKFISNIDGDYYSIMGLPLNLCYEELKHIEQY